MSLHDLMQARAEWMKRGEFLNKMPIYKHEEYRYFPTYYRTLSWYDSQIALAYEQEVNEGVIKIEEKPFIKENYF